MNFLKYRDARHFLEDTGFSVQEALNFLENEIQQLKQEVQEA